MHNLYKCRQDILFLLHVIVMKHFEKSNYLIKYNTCIKFMSLFNICFLRFFNSF